MSQAILDSLKQITADAGLGADGIPRAAPRSTDEAAAVLGLAHRRNWRVRIEGAATWMPPDAPADFALTTSRLRRMVRLSAPDLVATAQAGMPMSALARSLAAHRAWLALDPPGAADRTLGSVLATATAGPLAQRFGPVRDHVLGATVVAGDGRVVRAGGSVVKNVAGYDLTKLQIGGFGGFGVVTEVSLRLRTLPEATRSMLARGPMDELLNGARDLTAASLEPAGLELASPGLTGAADWTLILHLAGTRGAVDAAAAELAGSAGALRFEPVQGSQAADPFGALRRGALDGPVTIRLGALPDGLADTLELVGETLGMARATAGLIRGGIRWTGAATPEQLVSLRGRLAEREIPLTLERAPWDLRRRVGHFGAFREGVAALTGRLRDVFDPERILVVPAEGERG